MSTVRPHRSAIAIAYWVFASGQSEERLGVDSARSCAIAQQSLTAETETIGIASAPTDRVVTVQQLMQLASDMAMKAKVLSARNRVHVA
jgi:hypothetical protein